MLLPAHAVELEGTITAIDTSSREVSIARITANGNKILKVEIAPNAGDLSDLKVGDAITASYDPETEIVTTITSESRPWLFYDFMCSGVTPKKGLTVVSDSEVRCLPVSSHNSGRFMLVTQKQYDSGVFRCEFYYEDEKMDGNPFVGVASTLPTMKGSSVRDRFPRGIEVKLWHNGFGALVFWEETFKADMVYGQAREGRVVPPLKEQVPVRRGWNTLEIELSADNTILVKGNGVLLNAITKAENTRGHIVLFPPWTDFRFRNASIEVAGRKQSLLFTGMRTVPCK